MEPPTQFLYPAPCVLEKEKASCIIYRCLLASYALLKDAYALMQRLKLDRADFAPPLFIKPPLGGERVFPYRLQTICIAEQRRGTKRF